MTRKNSHNKKYFKDREEEEEKPKKVQPRKPIKETQVETVKDETICESEVLFWKMYKNTFIKTKILSFLDTKCSKTGFKRPGVFKYQDIVSVQWMLKNGYYELLKCKVKNGEYLFDFFKEHHELYPSKPFEKEKRYSIFEKIHDNEFYENLFKNYPLYFIKYNKYEMMFRSSVVPYSNFPSNPNFLKNTIALSLENDNLCSYSTLLKYYDIGNGVERFYQAVDLGSVKIAKLLFKTSKYDTPRNEIISKVWKNSTFLKPVNSDTKGEDQPPKLKSFKTINDIVRLLLVDLKLVPPKEMKANEDLFEIDIKSITLLQLFQSCFTISLLLEQTKFFDEFLKAIKTGKLKEKYQFYGYSMNNVDILPNPSNDFLSTIKLNEIKENLKLETNGETLVYKSSRDNIDILNLFKMLIPFTSYTNCLQNNFIFFNNKYFDKKLEKSVHSIRFGSLVSRLKYTNTNDLSILFQYCIDCFEVHQKFIENVIIDIKESTKNQKSMKIAPNILITMLLNIDRLDLIEITISQLESEISYSDIIPLQLFQLIKSVTTLDYFVSNSKLIGHLKTEMSYCFKSQGFGLLEHIKKNYNTFYKSLILTVYSEIPGDIEYSTEAFLFIYNNMNDFIHFYDRINIWTRPSNIKYTLDQFIQFVKGTPLSEKYTYRNCDSETELNQYHWVKVNRAFDLISKRCDTLSSNDTDTKPVIDSIHSYFSGEFDIVVQDLKEDLDKIVNVGSASVMVNKPELDFFNFVSGNGGRRSLLFFEILDKIGEFGDIQSLDTIMQLFKINERLPKLSEETRVLTTDLYSFFIKPLLGKSATHGRLNVFHFLQSNYPWIFNPKIGGDNKPNNSFFDSNNKPIKALIDTHLSQISLLHSSLISIAATTINLDLAILLLEDLLKDYFSVYK